MAGLPSSWRAWSCQGPSFDLTFNLSFTAQGLYGEQGGSPRVPKHAAILGRIPLPVLCSPCLRASVCSLSLRVSIMPPLPPRPSCPTCLGAWCVLDTPGLYSWLPHCPDALMTLHTQQCHPRTSAPSKGQFCDTPPWDPSSVP